MVSLYKLVEFAKKTLWNSFELNDNIPWYRKFDLKGSTVDREASDKELEKHLPTLKDNDFIKQKIKIVIGEDAKTKLFEILNADINVSLMSFCYFQMHCMIFNDWHICFFLQFLTKLHLMDYSLLVGIHDSAQAEEEALLNENANREAAAGRETSESEECESGER